MGLKSFSTEVYLSIDLKVLISYTWKMNGHLIDEYLIFMDNTKLWF